MFLKVSLIFSLTVSFLINKLFRIICTTREKAISKKYFLYTYTSLLNVIVALFIYNYESHFVFGCYNCVNHGNNYT